jgi:hypothetical protein
MSLSGHAKLSRLAFGGLPLLLVTEIMLTENRRSPRNDRSANERAPASHVNQSHEPCQGDAKKEPDDDREETERGEMLLNAKGKPGRGCPVDQAQG